MANISNPSEISFEIKSTWDPKMSILLDEIESELNQGRNQEVAGEIKESGFLEHWQKLNEKLGYWKMLMSD